MSNEKREYKLKARAERLAQTRQRIVEAAASLHAEVGPARTTVSEIARRARVQRDTVYNHFPDESDLFAACGDYSMSRNPPPNPSAALALDDPAKRLSGVLAAFYPWYRQMAGGIEHLYRDRLSLPALDAAMKVRMDRPLGALVDALAAGFGAPGGPSGTVHAVIALSLDFWTWRRLAGHGLSDEKAAELMVTAVQAISRAENRAN